MINTVIRMLFILARVDVAIPIDNLRLEQDSLKPSASFLPNVLLN